MACLGPPERLDNCHLGECGSYWETRPRLAPTPFLLETWPLRPQSFPAHFADQFRKTNGWMQNDNPPPEQIQLVWQKAQPACMSDACLPFTCKRGLSSPQPYNNPKQRPL